MLDDERAKTVRMAPVRERKRTPLERVDEDVSRELALPQLWLQLELHPERLPRPLVLDEEDIHRPRDVEAEPVDTRRQVQHQVDDERRLPLPAPGDEDQQSRRRQQALGF